MTPSPGVVPMAACPPDWGVGPRSVTTIRLPLGDRSKMSGAGSLLRWPARPKRPTTVSLRVSTTVTSFWMRSLTHR
jgi:hypothetical protein